MWRVMCVLLCCVVLLCVEVYGVLCCVMCCVCSFSLSLFAQAVCYSKREPNIKEYWESTLWETSAELPEWVPVSACETRLPSSPIAPYVGQSCS